MAKLKYGTFPEVDAYVQLREEDHRYFSTDGQEWKSWSSVSKQLVEPFHAHSMSLKCAGGDAAKARALREEWDEMREDACDYGHDIHLRMENFVKHGVIDWEMGEMQQRLYKEIMTGYEQLCPERTLYMRWPVPGTNGKEYRNYAGQSDKVFVRKGRQVIDIFDYKTNKRNGIRFNSDYVNKKTGLLMPGKKFMLPPLDHLEVCEYNKYALQLSGYGLMAQMTYGVSIGRMAEVYIFRNEEGKWDYAIYPVPYMKHEVMALYDFDASRKSIDKPF